MELTVLLSVALPGVLALVLALVAAFAPRTFNACGKRQRAETLLVSTCGAVAISGGFLLCYFLVENRLPDWPPRERWQWLALMAAGAGIIGIAHGLYAHHRLGRLVTGLALAAIAALMLHPTPSITHPGWWQLALGAAVLCLWLSGDTLAARRPGHVVGLIMMLVFTASSIAMAVGASSAKFATLMGSLACMSGAMMVVGLFAKRLSLAGGAMAVMSVLLPAFMMTGYFYDQHNT